MVDKVLPGILLFASLFYVVGLLLVRAEVMFFHLAMPVLLLATFYDEAKRKVEAKPFFVLLAVAIIQLIIYNFSTTNMNCVINIFAGVVGILIIGQYSNGFNRPMLSMIVLGGVINIVMTIAQNLGYSPIITNYGANDNTNLINGAFMGNAPRLGTYLALTFPFAWQFSPIAGILWLVGGLYLHQLPVFLVAFVMVFVWVYRGKNKTLYPLIAFPIVFAFVFKAHIAQSLSIRFNHWNLIVEQILRHPLLGLGLGQYERFITGLDPLAGPGEVAMSSWVEFFFNFGLIGGGVIVYFFVKDFIKSKLFQLPVICLAVLCLIEYPFEIPRFWPLLMAMGGFYLVDKNRWQLGEKHE